MNRYRIRPGDWTSDRETWLKGILSGMVNPKPPAWWIAAQAKEGRVGAMAYSIWHRNYKPERKYVIWDQAPDEDWREHGYLV